MVEMALSLGHRITRILDADAGGLAGGLDGRLDAGEGQTRVVDPAAAGP